VNPPAVVIRVEFERVEPVVFADYLDEGDELRMRDWLGRRPELSDLIRRALELADRERAA
jgi:hypothetical protein